jgi:hydrogenase expression/formation protein HypC
MCLGVPGRIISIADEQAGLAMGRVSFDGIVKEVCLACVPEATAGDYVIVHVGFAITMVDAAEAQATLGFLRSMGELDELHVPSPD